MKICGTSETRSMIKPPSAPPRAGEKFSSRPSIRFGARKTKSSWPSTRVATEFGPNPLVGNTKTRLLALSATNNSAPTATANVGALSVLFRGSGRSRLGLPIVLLPCPTGPDDFAGGDKVVSAGHDGSP